MKNYLLFGIIMLMSIGVVSATCSFCNETCSPCSGDCTSTDLSMMYMEYDFVSDPSGVGNISGWNTSCITNMNGMFYGATAFNQDIGSWNTSSVTDMAGMFGGATAFNQPLNSWDVSHVTHMGSMFNGVTLSTANYDALLNGWASQSVQLSIQFDGGSSQYSSAGKVGRDILTGTYGWNIIDGGLAPCTPSWTCSGYDTCNGNVTTGTGSRNCNAVTDSNNCSITYAGDYSEFTSQQCCIDINWCNEYNACQLGDIMTCALAVTGSNYGQRFIACNEWATDCGCWDNQNYYSGDWSIFNQPCDFCTPIYQCSGYGACQPDNNTYCLGVNDLGNCSEHTYAGDLSEFTQSCSFCNESWTQIPPTACNGLIDDYTIHYSDVNNCGTTTNLPVDNGTLIDCCIESWHSVSHNCINSQQLISYTDNNNCSTSYQLPMNNGSNIACSMGGGGSIHNTNGGSVEIPMITGGVTTNVNEPNALVRLWDRFWFWIKGLFGGN